MTCEEARRLIHEAHDDDRAGDLPSELRAHLAVCGACRELESDLTALRRALRALPAAPFPADALDAVWRETIRGPSKAKASGIKVWQLAAAATFVTALSTATFYFIYAPSPRFEPSPVELARASAEADLVFGYTARALAATREATAGRVLASRVSPAVRGAAITHPSRRPQ